ncbi:histone-lysine N-methyltransferase SETDB2 isoform X2 [Amblyraja radiata]|uniref:histone-lysine N-methyltransferase SETDB2 isoform X2 n=1 Tax=Amblyraja radiata TaxID=386614 RepID=UPI001403F72B|nr:histone-lysine N-methyltransferase SETDB2 isoform X2 [Amblyraja radiata]
MQRTRSGGMPSKCGFCKRIKEDTCSGEMLFSQDGQLVIHRRCLLFSFAPVISKIPKNENLCGISIQTIQKKLQKTAKMKCTHCHRSGAAVKCAVTNCRKVYHYPCVTSDNGAIKENEIRGVYRIWCHKHKTEQKLVEDSSFEHAEDVQDTVQPKGEMLEQQEGQHLCSKKADPQGHSSCMQTEILMKCEVKNCSKTCHLGCATSNNIKLMKNVEKGVDSGSDEDQNDKKALGSTSSNYCMDNGDEESCNDWEDNHKWKMRNKTKEGRLKKSQKHHSCLSNNHGTFEGSNVSKPTFQELDSFSCNNRNSNKMSNLPERDYLEHSDMNTEKIKGNTAELLQSKENPARVAESEENTSCMDIHNLEKAKLFWIKMQASRRVELVFEQLSNVITCLKKKISNGSANNQEYLKALNLLNKAGIYNNSLSPDTAENEERFQLNCEDISERLINTEEMEAELVLDNPLFLQTSVIKSLASCATCPSPTKELNYPNVPDRLILHQRKCNTMCIAGVMPQTSDHFKGENPLKIPILCRFKRRHAKLHWDTEVLEPPHVSYKAPCGRSLRNFKEVRNYIYETQCGFLLLDFFSFNTYIQLSRTFPCKNPVVYEADISHGIEPVPVSLHNAIDISTPEHFKYRKARLPHGCLISNSSEMFQQKCNCTNGCSDGCACQQLTTKVNKRFNKASGYEYKRLLQCAPSGVYECNKWCKCDKRMCENRVVQQGLTVRLQLFKTHKKGWGVRCMDDVDKGTFVCCYTGRILRTTNEIESQENEKAINVNDTNSGGSKTAMTFIKRERKDSNSEPECKLLQETEETNTSVKKDEAIPFLKTSPLITQNMELSGNKLRVSKSELADSELTSIERPKTKTALLQARRRKLLEQDQKLFMHSSSEEDERVSSAERPKRHSRTLLLSSPKKLKTLSGNHLINNDEGVSENKSSIDYRKSHHIPSGNILECPLFSQQAQQETDKQENKINNENGNIQNKLIQDDNHKQPMLKLHRICVGDKQEDCCYLLDATKEGNIGRFLNHSCDPNLMVQNVFVDTHDKNFPWVAFFTNRYIKAGSELTWDYNYSVGTIPEEEIPCLCGSIKCRNIIV